MSLTKEEIQVLLSLLRQSLSASHSGYTWHCNYCGVSRSFHILGGDHQQDCSGLTLWKKLYEMLQEVS